MEKNRISSERNGSGDLLISPTDQLSIRIYLLPNLLTTGNLFFGFLAMIMALKGQFEKAALAIVGASVFDMLDGRLARLTRATSRFGAEYDSLSDLVSFCVAPAIIMYLWSLEPFGRVGWIAAFIYLAGGALRLARFNVQAHLVEKAYFQGLPTPIAAGIVASSVLAFNELGWEPRKNPILLLITFLLGLVMVSHFRYRSFKDLDFKQRLPFRYLAIAILIVAAVAYWPEVNLFILFLSYATLGAIFGMMGWGIKKVKRNVYLPPLRNETDFFVEKESEKKELEE